MFGGYFAERTQVVNQSSMAVGAQHSLIHELLANEALDHDNIVCSQRMRSPIRDCMVSDPVVEAERYRPKSGRAGDCRINVIDNDVKMVVWDLDDTLWRGTLAEGDIEFIAERAEIVKALAARGIISSIASKNDYGTAKALLESERLWEYFVFPSIAFDPKGKRIGQIIKNAALRSQNVLFVDDSVTNLEEACFFNNGLMVATPDVLPDLLAHSRLAGKPDPRLTRLKQYQLLQRKHRDWQSTDLSNEGFLRSSEIRITFEFDVASHFDRVVELINRTNQLNYTKKRLATARDVELFRSSLSQRGISAACIACRDRYGDYGIVGFYALWRTTKERRLIHFVFSCRIMNMGIEQFVYDYLKRPDVTIDGDVAYGLHTHEHVNWITVQQSDDKAISLATDDRKLVLVGGCELLQLASYCGSNRIEFVNKSVNIDGDDYTIRYDDPYFFLADREMLRRDETIATWTHADALALDRAVIEADVVLVAMRAALRHQYVVTPNGLRFRMENNNVNTLMKRKADWFRAHYLIAPVSTKERLRLIEKCLTAIDRQARPHASIFVIGASLHKLIDSFEQTASIMYNRQCQEFCRDRRRVHFVDVSKILSAEQTIDDQHFTASGNRALSQYIMSVLTNAKESNYRQ